MKLKAMNSTAALHQRVVALQDRVEHHAAETGQGVDLLDDDGAAQEIAELDAAQRHAPGSAHWAGRAAR